VLALAAIFLMVGELLVFVPSIANFRINWLKQRVAMAEIAALAVEAAEDQRGVRAAACRAAGKDRRAGSRRAPQ
jgi:hypothetical protein